MIVHDEYADADVALLSNNNKELFSVWSSHKDTYAEESCNEHLCATTETK